MRRRPTDKKGAAGGPEKGGGKKPEPPRGEPRAKKVETLRESYRNGHYVVEPKKVADRMVDDAVAEIRAGGRRGAGKRH